MAATHEAALPQTNRGRASESYATSTARKNLHIGLADERLAWATGRVEAS